MGNKNVGTKQATTCVSTKLSQLVMKLQISIHVLVLEITQNNL